MASLSGVESGETSLYHFRHLNHLRNKLKLLLQKSRAEIEATGSSTTVQDCEYQHIVNTVALALLSPRAQVPNFRSRETTDSDAIRPHGMGYRATFRPH